MSYVRTSLGGRIKGVGAPPKSDWTQQSARFFKLTRDGVLTDEPKKRRRKCFKGQLVFDRETGMPTTGCTINRAETVRISTPTGAEREAYEGLYKGKRVRRDGYAYSMVKDGRTPGKWYYV